MLRLRPYKPCDAGTVIGWCRDQKTYQLWGGELIGPYPLTADKLNEVYFARTGLCAEPDSFYPVMACDENGPRRALYHPVSDGGSPGAAAGLGGRGRGGPYRSPLPISVFSVLY